MSKPKRPAVLGTSPLIVVSDLQRALDWYAKLAFSEPGIWGEPPVFAIVRRDRFLIMLSLAEEPDHVRPNGPDGLWDLYVKVADIEAEIAALADAGVTPARGPTDTFYQMREIECVDPDGYRICIAEDLSLRPIVPTERWAGTLDTGVAKLRLVLKLAPLAAGAERRDEWAARLDSLDQNAMDLPIDQFDRSEGRFAFEMDAIRARFESTNVSADRIEGVWSQSGGTWPLVFERLRGADATE
jgi:catechol 2,3-dioxygenase-like lactoylglutathione lyase family enzyme